MTVCLLLSSAHATLIAHYVFDDGDLLDNEVGTAYTLTHQSGGVGTTSVTLNATDGTAVFPGGHTSYDPIAWLQCDAYLAPADFSVSFWFRTPLVDQGQDYHGLFASGHNGVLSGTWQVHSDGKAGGVENGALCVRLDGNTVAFDGAPLHVAGKWYHVAIRKDNDAASHVQLYLTAVDNGSLNPPFLESANNDITLDAFCLGVNRGLNQAYGMEMSNVRIYDSSDVSIEALFNEGPVAGELEDPAAVGSFTADDYYVSPGAPVKLSWSVTNCSFVSISPDIGDVSSITVNGSGETNITLSSTTKYTLLVSNETATAQKTLEIFTGPPRPNVVLFLVDDMGITDTSVPFIFDSLGKEERFNFNRLYHTPAMETLAANGMRFCNAYAQSVCSPTRTSLMTGLNATGHGVTCWVNQTGTRIGTYSPVNYLMKGMTGNEDALPRRLSAAGYRTIHSGKAHFTYEYNPSVLDPQELPQFIGFDVNIAGSWLGHPGSYLGTADYASASRPSWLMPGLEPHHGSDKFLTEACTIEGNRAVAQAVEEGRPFFLYLAHYAVHAPFTADTRATNDYSAVSGDAFKFATMIEGMDRSLGDVLTQLDALGVAEETLIVFLGDNGSDNPLNTQEGRPVAPYNDFPLRGKKGGEWEGGTRVPLMISWARPDPSNPFQQALPVAPGSVEDDIVACWDVPLTILGAAGVEPPPVVHGYDLSGYLAATGGVHRPQEILLYSPHGRNGDYFANYRAGDWKLIYRWQIDSFALYNLADDPTETNNLAAVESAKVVSMARGMARRFAAEWGTPGVLWPTFGPLSTVNIMGSLDVDGDGRIDADEDVNADGLQDPGETDPDDRDSDGDGSDDNTEVRLGLDPLDPGEAFRLWINSITGDDITLQWPSMPGTVFNIRSTTDLNAGAGWPVAVSNVPAASVGNVTGRIFNRDDGLRFYKVELQ